MKNKKKIWNIYYHDQFIIWQWLVLITLKHVLWESGTLFYFCHLFALAQTYLHFDVKLFIFCNMYKTLYTRKADFKFIVLQTSEKWRSGTYCSSTFLVK